MRKKTLILLLVLILAMPISALAVNQKSNADVFLGTYNTRTSWTSQYCTATLSHLNLVVSNTSGSGKFTVERRAPNKLWTKMETLYISSGETKTYNINAVKGHDYRVIVSPRIALVDNPKGQVTCY